MFQCKYGQGRPEECPADVVINMDSEEIEETDAGMKWNSEDKIE